MNYECSSVMGTVHNFTTDKVDGVTYKYNIVPEARNVKFMNYLEIEKYLGDQLIETIMVSRKQVVYHDILKSHQWWHVFESGNKFSLQKLYTDEGAEWALEKKWDNDSMIANLQYDVKQDVIEHCLKALSNAEKEEN